jgi:hypothetical protein
MYCLRCLLPAFVRADMTLLIAKQFTIWGARIDPYLCHGQTWPSSLMNKLLFAAQELLPTFVRGRYDPPHCWTIYCLRHENCFLLSSGAGMTLLIAEQFTVWGARLASYLRQGQIGPSYWPNNLPFEAQELLPTFFRGRYDPPNCRIIYCLQHKNCSLPSIAFLWSPILPPLTIRSMTDEMCFRIREESLAGSRVIGVAPWSQSCKTFFVTHGEAK